MSNLPLPKIHAQSGLEDFIAISRYARYNSEKRRRETWDEAVNRVRDMHVSHFKETSLADAVQLMIENKELDVNDLSELPHFTYLHDSINAAFDAVRNRKVLPSMRSLQFGGEAVLNKHARIYNCCFTYIDRIDAFKETLYLLLCGCGVGFSVQTHHITQLPKIANRNTTLPPINHVIADTIEGWADALDILMRSAIDGRSVLFDYSLIRPAGAPLKTSGGKAPGPQPLFHTLSRVDEIMRGAAGRKLRSIEVYDILMWGAKAVLSGGVRRSATICLFSADDNEMAAAKTGDWFSVHPHRAASNNSAVIVRSEATREQFNKLFEAQKQYGEPGFYFVEDSEYGANPCVEIGLHPRLKVDKAAITELRGLGYTGELKEGSVLSGVQFCNLTTISANAVENPEDFYRLCAHASLIGTLQAGYTHFKYLSPISRVITEREALLGVSICGILDKPSILLDPQVLQRGANIVKVVNTIVAKAIGIQPAARTTCVKPEGTASLLLGTSSGLHPHHAKRYFRRVQTNVHDPIYIHFKRTNPHMVEQSVYDPNGRTDVITFPVEGPDFGIYREDVSALKHLEYIKLVQENWVHTGRRHEKQSPGLHHNVSCTVTVRPDEWQHVADFIWNHRKNFTGIALLQDSGDKAYAQAPREAIATIKDVEKWNSLSYYVVDYTSLEESEDITELKQTVACAGGACEIA